MKLKHLLLGLVLVAVNTFVLAQKVDYRARAEKNLKYLIKDSTVLNHIYMNDRGIYMFANDIPSTKRFPEIVLYWEEIEFFLDEVYASDYYESIEFYNLKGSTKITLPEKYSWDWRTIHEDYPTTFEDLSVALDPGHYAANIREILFEKKYLKIKGTEVGLDKDQWLFEAELNYACAKLLQYKLDSAGARTFISRDHGTSAVGVGFNEWYGSAFAFDVEHYVAQGDFSKERGDWLLNTATREEVFNSFYKYIDFVERIRRINYFRPDLTMIMHFNAEEDNPRDDMKYSSLVDQNYSMAFVPGSFMRKELKKQDARMDFLRLLFSRDLEESIRVGEIFLSRLQKDLGIDPIPQVNELGHVKRACVETGVLGLYSRNLALTRQIRSPLVYTESAYQDNKDEFAALIKKDYRYKNIVTSKRVAEVAEAHFQTIIDWLEDNKVKNHEANNN